MSARAKDMSTNGFVNWPLTSVATWGESSNGIWKVIIQDHTNEQNSGEIGSISLIVHGTSDIPAHMQYGPRKYSNNNYQEVFDYFEGVLDNPNSDDNSVANVPEEHSSEDVNVNNIDPTILAEVEKELQRIHHNMVYNRSPGL